MEKAISSPEVIAAIISAVTALTISLASGLYVVFRATQSIRSIRTEILTKLGSESIFQDRTVFFEAVRQFQGEVNAVVAKMQVNGQTVEGNHLLIEKVLAFYGRVVLPFYEKHREIIKSKSIDSSIDEISELLKKDSENLSDPNRIVALNAVLQNIQRVIYEIKNSAQGF